MEVNVRKNGVYVPKWRGNDKLSAKDQIKIHHRFLTSDERDDYIYLEDATVGQLTGGDALNRKYVQDGKGIAKLVTTKIENLSIKDENGEKINIEDIDTLYQYSFPLLTAEYEMYLLNASQVVDSKNDESPSG